MPLVEEEPPRHFPRWRLHCPFLMARQDRPSGSLLKTCMLLNHILHWLTPHPQCIVAKFLLTQYTKAGKYVYTKLPLHKLPIGHKIYQIAEKISKWPNKYQHSPFHSRLKFIQIGIFWFENNPFGYPAQMQKRAGTSPNYISESCLTFISLCCAVRLSWYFFDCTYWHFKNRKFEIWRINAV
jgi:hypothetical protein